MAPASGSSSSSSSSRILNPILTPEEFKTFHSIDRTLYTRLVLNLSRDPAESMQVMALWIWLERAGHVDDLVDKMLSLPDTLINSLAEEAVLCLNCIESDQFHFSSDTHDVPLIHSLTRTGLSLRFFHESRLSILRAVTKIVNEVCARAFGDISRQSMDIKQAVGEGISIEKVRGQEMKPLSFYGPVINRVLPVLYHNGVAGAYGQMGGPQFMGSNMSGGQSSVLRALDPYDLAVQRQFLNTEIADALRSMQISSADQEQRGVPEDNRTIFLTFSKGYPISLDKVRDFFTRYPRTHTYTSSDSIH